MSQVNGQFMKFKADEDAMVNHMIHSQNGTVPTAIRELVMNSIDKGADRIGVEISSTHFRVKDTGIGFASREDVEKHFLTFGTPHQDGDATFGRFRIGRGQIMSLSKVQWHSHEFRMVTDVRNKGNGMELFVDTTNVFGGCDVSGEFYQSISARDEITIRQEVRELVQYLDVPVYLNGEWVNDLSCVTWDYEDSDVRIRWEPAGERRIKLYSIGVYVKDLPMYRYGISAHVVTKKSFDLNMARNEISASDPLWFKIEDLVRKYGQKKSRERASRGLLDDAGRCALIGQVISGEIDLAEVMRFSFLKDVRGHSVKMHQLCYASTQKKPVTVALKDDHKMGERLAVRGDALVLHADNLNNWNCSTPEAFFSQLVKKAYESRDLGLAGVLERLNVQSVGGLSVDIDDQSEEIDEKTLSPKLKAALSAVQKAGQMLMELARLETGEELSFREVKPGKSDVNEAWTNGMDTVWVNVDLLKLLDKDSYGADYVAGVILHEYGHDFSNAKGHDHDFDFYNFFHNMALHGRKGVLGRLAAKMRRTYLASLTQKMEKLPKWAFEQYETQKIKEVHVFRDGPEISKAAEILIKASGAKVDMKPSKALMLFDGGKSGNIGSKLVTALWTVLKKDKRLALDRGIAFDACYRAQRDEYDRLEAAGVSVRERAVLASETGNRELAFVWGQFEEALAGWLEANGQCRGLAHRVRHIRTYNDFLVLLCMDSESGFSYFTYETQKTVKVSGSGHHFFEGDEQDHRNLNRNSYSPCKPEILAIKKNEREMAATSMIYQALDLMADDMERDTLAKKILSEQAYLEFRAKLELKYQ